MLKRNLTSAILKSLKDTPVVLINGARQTGKSTLVQWIATQEKPATYVTLDDDLILAAATHDPSGFLEGQPPPLAVDEIQRAPQLFRAIKAVVDRHRRPGSFLLTGSANVFLLPRLSDSLAGRMEILTLWPLSQGEIRGHVDEFVDAVFEDHLTPAPLLKESRRSLFDRMLIGGYPEVVHRPEEERRHAWFRSYVNTILGRDIREFSHVENLSALPRLLSLLATRSSGLLNFSELSRTTTIPQSSLKRYVTLLEAAFLVHFLPAWSGNLGKRLVKAPKIFLGDTGLMAYLMGLNADRLKTDATLHGPLAETFVTLELLRQITWSRVKPALYHYRSPAGQEVDNVLENRSGRLVGIEVKARSTVTGADFRGLHHLAETIGKRFLRGIVLYAGERGIAFGTNMHALPISALWQLKPKK